MSGIRFRADVTIHLDLYLDAAGPSDAVARATAIACGRTGVAESDIVRVVAAPLTLTGHLSRAQTRTWQEEHAVMLGTDLQHQRWAFGQLPECDLLSLAREELFRGFAEIQRRTRKGPSAIPHRNGVAACASGRGIVPVRWSTVPEPDLTDAQWSTLRRILLVAEDVRRHEWMNASPPTSVRVAVREHRGMCLACHGVIAEQSALVEIDWADRLLTREYAL